MKIKVKRLEAFLAEHGIGATELSRKMDVGVSEIEKLLAGDAADMKTAQCFIEYFGVDTAQGLIDWDAMGKDNPFACEADEECGADGEEGDI